MNDGTWIEIAAGSGRTDLPIAQRGGRITDVLPSPFPSTPLGGEHSSAITESWVGGAVDVRRAEYMMIGGGGHADYPGNEGYALSLRNSTPAWRRISDPTPNARLANYTNTNGVLTYSDGRPRADHTSGFPVWLDGKVWFGAQSATPAGGNARAGVSSFNRDALGAAASPMPHTDNGGTINPWTCVGPIPGMDNADSNGSYTFGCGCADPWGHYTYNFSGFGADRTTFWYWRVNTLGPSAGQIEMLVANGGNPFANAMWCVCAHDLRIILVGDGANHRVLVLDISGAAMATSFQIVSSFTGTPYTTGRCSGGYLPISNAIILGDPQNLGGTLKKIKIPTKISNGRKVYDSAGTFQCSDVITGGVTPTTTAADSGTFGKFRLVPDMGDGRMAFVFVGGIDRSTFLYKIPAAGL